MSFILDALKKSESDRQRQSGPALFEVKVAPPRTGLPPWAMAVAALLVVVLHPAMAWATRADAMIAEVYVRSLGAQDFYPPVAGWRARPAPVRPALPRGRG